MENKINLDKYITDGNNNTIEKTGTNITITYKRLFDLWDTYKNYYIESEGALVDEIFYIDKDEGKLYKIKPNYTINGDGLLCIRDVVPPSSSIENNMFKGMYLSNNDFKFYTRYKFNLTSTTWAGSNKYQAIPKDGMSTINNGRSTIFVESCTAIISSGRDLNIGYARDGINSGVIKIT